MLKKIVLIAVASLVMLGCGKNDADNNSDITDYNSSELFQTVKAKQTALRSGFSFTAAGDWSAWCTEDPEFGSSDGKQWVQVVPSSGKAGRNTIYVTFSQNMTNKMRRAYVNISCGETFLRMSIDQESESEGAATGSYDILNVFADTEYVDNAGVSLRYQSGYNLVVTEEKNGNIVMPDWIEVSTSKGVITLKINKTHASRSAVIELWNGNDFIWMTEIIQSAVCEDGSYPL